MSVACHALFLAQCARKAKHLQKKREHRQILHAWSKSRTTSRSPAYVPRQIAIDLYLNSFDVHLLANESVAANADRMSRAQHYQQSQSHSRHCAPMAHTDNDSLCLEVLGAVRPISSTSRPSDHGRFNPR